MPADVRDLPLERALAFFTRRHSGGPWTDADEAALQAWLSAADAHRAAYARVARAWDATGALAGHIHRGTVPRRRPLRRLALACAALLLLAFVPLSSYRWWYGTPERWVTQPGEPRQLKLADGTGILMDSGTQLVVQMGAGSRQVSLLRGEAEFTVRHNPARPFEVHAAGGTIRDLGTRFHVEILGKAVHVAVWEGEVELSTPRGHLTVAAGSAGGYEQEGAFLPVATATPPPPPGPQRHFDAEPLADVLERFARHHGVSFVFTDNSLKALRLSGSFRIDDLPTFLRTLSVALPIQTRTLDPQRIEISRRVDSGPQPALNSVQ